MLNLYIFENTLLIRMWYQKHISNYYVQGFEKHWERGGMLKKKQKKNT